MHLPSWTLSLLCSYLSSRSLVLSYQSSRSTERSLPGGYGAGTLMGGLLFVIKFNGACLRPPVPRPISGNRTLQRKYIDDSSKVASYNLKKSLMCDPEARPQPWKYHERKQQVLKPEEDILSEELDRFHYWTIQNKLKINYSKCYVMQFSRSTGYDFPPEFSIGDSHILEEKNTMSILGIQVQANLRWDAQVTQMVTRASKAVWVLRRMKALGVDKKTLVQYWKSEGRVHLEMACPVWHSSITLAQSRSLERSQRVAMAAIAGQWAPSLTNQLAELGLERLSSRRDTLCARFAVATATKSRHKDIFTPAYNNSLRPGKHSLKYRVPWARTAAYRKSAVPYLTRLLNSSQF